MISRMVIYTFTNIKTGTAGCFEKIQRDAYRRFMQYSGKIKVISPEKLKEEIRDKIKEASQIYQC